MLTTTGVVVSVILGVENVGGGGTTASTAATVAPPLESCDGPCAINRTINHASTVTIINETKNVVDSALLAFMVLPLAYSCHSSFQLVHFLRVHSKKHYLFVHRAISTSAHRPFVANLRSQLIQLLE